MEASIRRKANANGYNFCFLVDGLKPVFLEIINDSKKHAGHSAMKGVASDETHFQISVVSGEFQDKPLIQRHRLVYSLLDEEFKQGLHALNISAKTPAEVNKQ